MQINSVIGISIPSSGAGNRNYYIGQSLRDTLEIFMCQVEIEQEHKCSRLYDNF